eukprot:CAMPEP_0171401472 /NCGR_PEP_ID=MMETSP0880-20121228/7928_1 /TAXON_ID=67004 /ORGANISM="Thalassiosira weissflogii, Strain CCMP1336" /LENGTH=232 /DNA_ID=CAMNT_0011915975 /DNA_START=1 /DNA_END=696 /DNA_ORIENTATION=+
MPTNNMSQNATHLKTPTRYHTARHSRYAMQLTTRNKRKYGWSSTPSTNLIRDEESASPDGSVELSLSPSSPTVDVSTFHRRQYSTSNTAFDRQTTDDDSSNILNDMIKGITLGIVFVFILLFLDYRNFIHLGSARVFREAAFQLLTDPQTVQSLEESLDVKFISTDVYDAIHREIGYIQKKVQEKQGEIAEKEKEIDGYRLEAKPIVEEFDELIVKANELFELDKFCGDCKW